MAWNGRAKRMRSDFAKPLNERDPERADPLLRLRLARSGLELDSDLVDDRSAKEVSRYREDIQIEVVTANREHRELSLTDEQLRALGHHKQPLLKVLRSFCLQCMGGNAAEVRRCTSPGCALFPYRMGKNPFSGRRGNAIGSFTGTASLR